MYRPVSIFVLQKASYPILDCLLVLAVSTLVLPQCFDKQLEDFHIRVQLLVSLSHKFLFNVVEVLLHPSKSVLPLLNLLLLGLNLVL